MGVWGIAAWRCGAVLRGVLVVGGQARAPRGQVRIGMARTAVKAVTAASTQGHDAGRRR